MKLKQSHNILKNRFRSASCYVYCILDDGKAREKATDLGIKFTGLVGLLQRMKQKNVMNHDDIGKIVKFS